MTRIASPPPLPLLLVSCARCRALHRPSDPLAVHALCAPCERGSRAPEERPAGR